MRKLVLISSMAILVGSAGAAFAVDVDGGAVRSIDSGSGSVTLMDGRSFKISNPSLLSGVIPGEKVIITVNDDKTVGFSEDSSQWDGGGQTAN